MQPNKRSNRPPDPAPPRVRRDAKDEREARHCGEARSELSKVARGRPLDAKVPVLVLTLVLDARGEGAALVVRVLDFASVGPAGKPDDVPLACAGKAVLDGGPGTQQVGVHNQPTKMTIIQQN